ncbi:uncharacterized protein LOC141885759 [Acropora palmata]|uniref:uncharacterized protein LOC141885759 n=1 Tax=Acropora palmata TaxID=6131 RepID=UPI003DA01CF2
MAVFECCTKQFVKDTGRLTLRPVVDLNSAIRFNILCVVIKKRSRWIWKSVKYEATPFTLNEILTKPVDCVSKFEKSVFIRNYKNEPKFDVKGKLGGKLAQYFGIDASSIDSFTVDMNVGTVTKREVKWDVLNQLLADNTLNVDHEFVQTILGKPRRSLCIVYETVSTGRDADVDSDADQEDDANVTGGKSKFSINLSGSVQAKHHRSFELPNHTILGFACYEMTIDAGLGTFQLVLPDSIDGGDPQDFKKRCVFDEPDGQNDKALAALFDDLFNSPYCSKIVQAFREILAYPSAIPPLRDLLEQALSCCEEKNVKALALAEFKTGVGAGYKSCEDLLTLLGFKLEDDMKFTEEVSLGVLHCCTGLAEALVELSSQQCKTIKEVTAQYKEPLLYLLKNTMYERVTSADDKLFERVWTHSSNPAKELLLTLGFEQVTKGNDKLLVLQYEFEHIPLEDVYVAVFVLCSK